jgi:hypothetical protein
MRFGKIQRFFAGLAVAAGVVLSSATPAAANVNLGGSGGTYYTDGNWQRLNGNLTSSSSLSNYTEGGVQIGFTGNTANDEWRITNNGPITVVGDTVYYNGVPFGTIEGGQGGLSIDFSVAPKNASFETGNTNSWDIDGGFNLLQDQDWAVAPTIPDDDPTIDDLLLDPFANGDDGSSDDEDAPPYCTYEVKDSSAIDDIFGFGTQFGDNALYVENFGEVEDGYGTMHCPFITSSEFRVRSGALVQAYIAAKDLGDDYSFYALLTNKTTGVTERLLYQTGGGTDGWLEIEETIGGTTCPSGICTMQFQFLFGGYDRSGGELVNAGVALDTIRIYDNVSQEMIDALMAAIEYRSTDPAYAEAKECSVRNLGLGLADADGGQEQTYAWNFCPPPDPICDLKPDMEVRPQYIYLNPGETATVEVGVRNLCNDRITNAFDVLTSFSDWLILVDASTGVVLRDHSALMPQLTLGPGETRFWSITVRAPEQGFSGPVHITEMFWSGRGVDQRIDGVFIMPEPVVAPAPAPAPEPAPAPAPPALPVTLPNTAGEIGTAAAADSLLPLLPLLAATLAAALLMRRRLS